MKLSSSETYFPVLNRRRVLRFLTWMPRTAWRLRKVVPILVLVLIVLHAGATLVLGTMVEREIAGIKARGEPVSFADLAGPPIPGADNAAVIYEQIGRKLDSLFSDRRLRVYVADSRLVRSHNKPPDVYFSGLFFYPSKLDEKKYPAAWTAARSAASMSGDIVRLTEEAVLRPQCRFPQGRSFWGTQTNLTRLLSIRCLVSAKDGDMDEAVRDMGLIFRVAGQPRADISKNDSLRWTTTVSKVSDVLRAVARLGDFTEPQARQLADTLAALNVVDPIRRNIPAERVAGLYMFEQNARYGVGLSSTSKRALKRAYESTSRVRGPVTLEGVLMRPLVYGVELGYLRGARKAIELVGLPSTLKPSQSDTSARAEASDLSALRSLCYPRNESHRLTVYNWEAYSALEAVAQIYGSRVFLGLLAYKDRFGAYPWSLDQLRTKLNWSVPKDPYTGKDFIYGRWTEGFSLYSWGKDHKGDDVLKPEALAKLMRRYRGSPYPNILWYMDR